MEQGNNQPFNMQNATVIRTVIEKRTETDKLHCMANITSDLVHNVLLSAVAIHAGETPQTLYVHMHTRSFSDFNQWGCTWRSCDTSPTQNPQAHQLQYISVLHAKSHPGHHMLLHSGDSANQITSATICWESPPSTPM